MAAIVQLKECLKNHESLIYNFAYRLTGGQREAVKLIVNAAKASLNNPLPEETKPLNYLLMHICMTYQSHPEQYTAEKATGSNIELFINGLPTAEKIALALHDILKLPREEILQITGFTEVNLKKELYNARDKLKEFIKCGKKDSVGKERQAIG